MRYIPLMSILFGIVFAHPTNAALDLPSFFEGTKESCFILYDVRKNIVVEKYETNHHCDEAFAPSSNFLLPLSVMAFDSHVIPNQQHVFAWNHEHYENKKWEKDQTTSSWSADSVGWVSQQLVDILGREKITTYLRKMDYGTIDIHSDLTDFWKNEDRLRITPNQQLAFMKALSVGTLPVSKQAMRDTKENFTFAQNNGWKLMGKPAAGTVVGSEEKYGWFIGEVRRNAQAYVVITNIVGTPEYYQGKCAGCKARTMTMQILQEAGLF